MAPEIVKSQEEMDLETELAANREKMRQAEETMRKAMATLAARRGQVSANIPTTPSVPTPPAPRTPATPTVPVAPDSSPSAVEPKPGEPAAPGKMKGDAYKINKKLEEKSQLEKEAKKEIE